MEYQQPPSPQLITAEPVSVDNPVLVPHAELAAGLPPESPKTSKKKLLLIPGIIVVVLVLLVGGLLLKNALFPAKTGPVTLTYWGLWEPQTVVQPIINAYQKLHPEVTISYEQRPVEDHYATVKSRISSQTGQTTPDIVQIHDSWVPVLNNYLSSVPASVMSVADYAKTFYPVTKDTLLAGGQYYAMPLEVDGLSLVYNQKLFNQAGIASAPVTWDDARADAAKITKLDDKGNVTVGGIALGTSTNVDNFPEIIGLLMAQNGVTFTDTKGNVTVGSSFSPDGRNLGAEALSFYTMFASTEKDWDGNMEPSTLAFTKGKVGMILVPSWQVLSLVEQNPDLQIKVTAVPQLAANQHVDYASYWAAAVPKSSPHQQAAWDFIKFMTDKDQQTQMFNLSQQVRSFGEPYARQDLASSLTNDALLGPYIQQAPGYRASLFASSTGATKFNDAINQALATAIVQNQSSGSDSADALTQLDTAINGIIAGQR